MKDAITLRPALLEDDLFLYQVYASTREVELAKVPWDATQKEAFLRFQFNAQHSHYRLHFPNAAYQVICAADRPIGRLYVERQPDEIRILDIALLPEYRGGSIGGALLRDLMAEAAASNRPLRLRVERDNPALRLYERLGFRKIGQMGLYVAMEWRDSASDGEEQADAGRMPSGPVL